MKLKAIVLALSLAAPLAAQLPAPVLPPIATNAVGTLIYPGCGWSPWCNLVNPALQCVTQPTWIFGESQVPNGYCVYDTYVSFGMTDGNTTPSNYTGFFVVWYDNYLAPWSTTALPAPFDSLHNLLLVPTGMQYATIPVTHTQQNAFSHMNLAGFKLPPIQPFTGLAIFGQSLSIDNSGVFRLGGAVQSPIVP